MKILIVEDEEILSTGIEQSLKKEGFETITAASGKEALHILNTKNLGAVVLDVSISDMDGWEVCKKIKPSIPLIILYLATERDMREFKELGLKYTLDRSDNFPVLIEILKEVAPRKSKGAIKKHKITLLVVEDDKMILNIVKSLFELEGYKVFTALNPYKALKILEENNYEVDMIISDVAMPKMDGISFFLKLKEIEKAKDIPFVMLTSKDQFEDIKVAYDVGIKEYISKPFDPMELLSRVEEFLTIRKNMYYERYKED